MDDLVADTLAEMQRKLDRQRFAASRLQRAHNRTLKRLSNTVEERNELRSLIEATHPHAALQYAYRLWCHRRGIHTPEEKRDARVREEVRR